MTNVPLHISVHNKPLHSRTDITEITLKPSKQSPVAEATVRTAFDHLQNDRSFEEQTKQVIIIRALVRL